MAATTRRRPNAKPPQIKSVQADAESINALVYGDSGVGKTVFGGSDNVLILAVEDGTQSAARQGSKADVWRIKKWDDLADAHDWIDANPGHGYDWIVVDSATEMQQLCMRSILDAAVAENKSRDPDIPALQDWQKYYNMFLRFVSQFNALPVNVLYTATVMRSENEDGEDVVLPNIPGKDDAICQNVCAKMGHVGHMSIQRIGKGEGQKLTRFIQFASVPPYIGKDRGDVLGRRFVLSVEEGGKVTQRNNLRSMRDKLTASNVSRTATTASPASTTARPARGKRTPSSN